MRGCVGVDLTGNSGVRIDMLECYRGIILSERIAYCFDGNSCEEQAPQWEIYPQDDIQSDISTNPLILKPEQFPVGTRIIAEMPVCPQCDRVAGMCECGFNWKQWVEDKYG